MLIGYARVSSLEQNTSVQVMQLEQQGCTKIFQDIQSGKSSDRQQLNELIDFVRDGDTVHVMKVDRLARNTIDALTIADKLKAKGVGLIFHDLSGCDINSDVGRVIYTTISAFAEMERKRILQRCNEGRAKAKADGRHMGRKHNQQMHDEVRRLFADGMAKAVIAKNLNVSRQTIYTVLKST
ncbi:recombinase family protein [Shewanella aestuarii]|uniref:Recombinase family protein n=1 Tax=Shewanella aestuarii TaxID=1028752 RepID=A0A6G9QGH6_9GAMM|nr:recombinase family protein [Shewanella aestuarii]QIR13576.1 recombinase family protein [Shewanella aestuarii]